MQTVGGILLQMFRDVGTQLMVEKMGPVPKNVKVFLMAEEGTSDIISSIQKVLNPFEILTTEKGKSSFRSLTRKIKRYKHTRVVIILKRVDNRNEKKIRKALSALRIKSIIEEVFVMSFEDNRSYKNELDVITPGG